MSEKLTRATFCHQIEHHASLRLWRSATRVDTKKMHSEIDRFVIRYMWPGKKKLLLRWCRLGGEMPQSAFRHLIPASAFDRLPLAIGKAKTCSALWIGWIEGRPIGWFVRNDRPMKLASCMLAAGPALILRSRGTGAFVQLEDGLDVVGVREI